MTVCHSELMTKKKTNNVLQAAADAGHEIAAAVESLGETWEHVEKAQKKAAPATKAASHAGQKAIKAIIKRAIPNRRRTRN
jgi:hypothetical protein